MPIVELPDGTFLLDSKILMDYANDAYSNQGYSTLPNDPVQRAQMRMAIPLVAEAFFASWTTMLGKRAASEDDMKAFNSRLTYIEDYIGKNGNSKSPFLLGTENPTQLDIHTYACLARPYFTKDSAFHETFWTKMSWNLNPRVLRFFDAMRARPEFKPALSNPKTHHIYYEAVS